jgi:predicted nucleotidyltransferase
MKTDSIASKAKALRIAKKAAAFLLKRGATRVILFGSLVTDDYHPGSDIDIYFEGIDYDQEFSVAGDALTAFREVELDLIPAGHSRAALKKLVEEQCLLL